MNETSKTGIPTGNRIARTGRMLMAAGALAIVLAWPGTVRADVTLNGTTTLNGGTSMNSTPAIAKGSGSGTTADPWVYDFTGNSGTFAMGTNQLKVTGGNSFKLDLSGLAVSGTSGYVNLLSGREPSANYLGSITLVNAGDIAMGAISTHLYAGGVNGGAGSITLGTAAAPVGNLQVDSLDAGAGDSYCDYGAGSVSIYSTGDVLIRTSGGTAGNIDTYAVRPAGAINIQHNGSFLANDVQAYNNYSTTLAGSFTCRGNAAGGAPSGAFQVRTINTRSLLTSGYSYCGAIAIHGYTNVHVTGHLLTDTTSTWINVSSPGSITITNCGDIQVDGTINASEDSDTSRSYLYRWGILTMQATGTITLASLDLYKVQKATLSASNSTYITGDLLNFPTNNPKSGLLDAATNTTIYYIWNTPNNTYLKNTNYTLLSGGRLVGQAADVPVVANAAVSSVTTTSAFMNGFLNTTGRTPTTVSVLWGTKSGGANAAAWANTNTFDTGQWNAGDYPATNIATLAANANYYYTYYASEAGGSMIAPSPVSFITGELTVQATVPTCRVTPGDAGIFAVYRPAGCTNEDLVVNYTLGGTATNVTDYTITPASGSVVLSRGQTNGLITIAPVLKYDVQKTVVLTLTNGPYALVSAAPATVTLAAMGPIDGDVTLTNSTTLTGRVDMATTPVIHISGVSPGAGTAANPWFYSFVPFANGTFIMGTNQLKTVNGDSFKLDLNGMAVTGASGKTNLTTATGAGVLTDFRCGSITLINAGDISIGGVSTHLRPLGGTACGAGSITLGTDGAPVGNLRADWLDAASDSSYCGGGSGAINVYSTGNVMIQTAGNSPGNMTTVGLEGPSGAIGIQHHGAFVANDVLSYDTAQIGRNAIFCGNVGGAPAGAFQAHTIDTSSRHSFFDPRPYAFSGSIAIQGYTDVHLTGDLLAYADSSGYVDKAPLGSIMITNCSSIAVDGAIDASARGYAYGTLLNQWGTVTLYASDTITLANLDLHKMQYTVLSAGQGATIRGYLLNFPTNTPASGILDAPTNLVVYYNSANASNAYLAAATYTLKSGGKLRKSPVVGTSVFFR